MTQTKLEKIRKAFEESMKDELLDFETIPLKQLINWARKLKVPLVACPGCGNNLLTPTKQEKELIKALKKVEKLPFEVFEIFHIIEKSEGHF